MSNRTYVCIDCRKAIRSDAAYGAHVSRRCASCSRSLVELPWDWRIPRKNDEKGWGELRVLMRSWAEDRIAWNRQMRVSLLEKLDRQQGQAANMKEGPAKLLKLKQLAFKRKEIEEQYPVTHNAAQQGGQLDAAVRRQLP